MPDFGESDEFPDRADTPVVSDPIDDDAVREVVVRLARPHRNGGYVVDRAAILAEGADAVAILAWIIASAGVPEAASTSSKNRGLYGSLFSAEGTAPPKNPARYILPAGALSTSA
jgi:hypothetical protein